MTAPSVINSYTGLVSGSLTPHVANVVVPGGTVNAMILVMFNAGNNAPMSAASWNGESFTMMATGFRGYYDSAAWLRPSSTGTHDVIVTVPFFSNNGGMAVWVLGGAVAVSANADLQYSNPFDTFASATLTTTANDSLVVDYCVNVNPTNTGSPPAATQGSGQTLVTNAISGLSWIRQTTSYKTVSTAGTPTTMTVTAPPTNQMSIELFEVMSVVPVAAFTPSVIII